MNLKAGETVWCPGAASGMLCILKEGQEPPKSREGVLRCQLEVLKRLVEEADAVDPCIIDEAESLLREELPERMQMLLEPGFLRREKGRALLVTGSPEEVDAPIERWRMQADPRKAGRPLSQRETLELAEQLDLMRLAGSLVEGSRGSGLSSHEA